MPSRQARGCVTRDTHETHVTRFPQDSTHREEAEIEAVKRALVQKKLSYYFCPRFLCLPFFSLLLLLLPFLSPPNVLVFCTLIKIAKVKVELIVDISKLSISVGLLLTCVC